MRIVSLLGAFIWLAYSCSSNSDNAVSEQASTFQWEIPLGFSIPQVPEGNPMTPEKVALGKQLFFDPILSKDFSISCGSCHSPDLAFSDSLALSLGAEGDLGERNAPSLANAAYKPHFFKDGGIPTLELQILAPFDNHLEFDLNIVTAVERLKNKPEYVEAFEQVFGTEPTVFGLTRSIAAYERTLLSGNSPWDKHFMQETPVLSPSALRGYDLFRSSELRCNQCHSGTLFSNFAFENNGLLASYSDTGRARISLQTGDAGKFVVPSLRNVAVTGPYMFDGSLSTLSDVLDHYASGGSQHRNKSDLITGFELSSQDKEDLITFLESLTDESFLANMNHRTSR